MTRGPRSRTSCRNNRTHLRTNSSYASSSASSQRRDRRGTSALCHRRQATLGSSRRRVPLIRACYLFFDIALALSLARRSIFDDQSLPACAPIRLVAPPPPSPFARFLSHLRSPIGIILDLVVPRVPRVPRKQRRFRCHDASIRMPSVLFGRPHRLDTNQIFFLDLLARNCTRDKLLSNRIKSKRLPIEIVAFFYFATNFDQHPVSHDD